MELLGKEQSICANSPDSQTTSQAMACARILYQGAYRGICRVAYRQPLCRPGARRSSHQFGSISGVQQHYQSLALRMVRTNVVAQAARALGRNAWQNPRARRAHGRQPLRQLSARATDPGFAGQARHPGDHRGAATFGNFGTTEITVAKQSAAVKQLLHESYLFSDTSFC